MLILCVYLRAGVHAYERMHERVSRHICRSQWTTCRNHFFPCTIWDPDIKLSQSDLTAIAFPHWAISLIFNMKKALVSVSYIYISCTYQTLSCICTKMNTNLGFVRHKYISPFLYLKDIIDFNLIWEIQLRLV